METFDWDEMEKQFARLPMRKQMRLLERLFIRMRKNAYGDRDLTDEELARQMEEMAKDPGILEAMNVIPPESTSSKPVKESA